MTSAYLFIVPSLCLPINGKNLTCLSQYYSQTYLIPWFYLMLCLYDWLHFSVNHFCWTKWWVVMLWDSSILPILFAMFSAVYVLFLSLKNFLPEFYYGLFLKCIDFEIWITMLIFPMIVLQYWCIYSLNCFTPVIPENFQYEFRWTLKNSNSNNEEIEWTLN